MRLRNIVLSLAALPVSAALLSGQSIADEADKGSEDTKVTTSEITITLDSSGPFTIGPDGKIDLSGDADQFDVFLPSAISDQLRKISDDAGLEKVEVIRMEMGEATKELEKKVQELMKQSGNLSTQIAGRVMVMGADGKEIVHEFGPGGVIDVDAIGKSITDIIKQKSGMSQETAQKQAEEAKAQLEKAMKLLSNQEARMAQAKENMESKRIRIFNSKRPSAKEDVNALILKRLDDVILRLHSLEKDVSELKEKK